MAKAKQISITGSGHNSREFSLCVHHVFAHAAQMAPVQRIW